MNNACTGLRPIVLLKIAETVFVFEIIGEQSPHTVALARGKQIIMLLVITTLIIMTTTINDKRNKKKKHDNNINNNYY